MERTGLFKKYLNVFRFLNPDYTSALEKEVSMFSACLDARVIVLSVVRSVCQKRIRQTEHNPTLWRLVRVMGTKWHCK